MFTAMTVSAPAAPANVLKEVLAINNTFITAVGNNPRLVGPAEFGLTEDGAKLKVITTITDTFGAPVTSTDFYHLTPDNKVDTKPGMSYKLGRH